MTEGNKKLPRKEEAEKARLFVHGGDRKSEAARSGQAEEGILDFSANINPLGMPEGVRRAARESLDEAVHYPDPFCRELIRELSRCTGQKEERILCGNGGADLIYRLVFALKPKKALVTAPAFAEYEEALTQAGAWITFHELGKSLRVTESFVDKVTEDTDLVFLCNPNNPTGLLTEKELIRKLLARAKEKKARVCLDECFLDFVRGEENYSAADLLEEYPGLVILKSFTKLYAMPGLRLGYVLSADTELLEKMRRAGQPWSVSAPAQAAGIAALKEKDFREKTVSCVEQERTFLKEGLESRGYEVLDGKANYLCFLAPGEENLKERLLEKGILIRSCANYRGLGPEYFRTAVRTREENERLLKALSEKRKKNE